MCKLYSLSDQLREKVCDMVKLVECELKGLVKFEEYIVLLECPEKVIIRFDLISREGKSLEELDVIENKIRNILGKEYWGNLVGNNYEKVGFKRELMLDSLKSIDLKVNDKVIKYEETSNCFYLKNDKDKIKESLNLTPQQRIWEVQILNGEEDSDAAILIVDESIESDSFYEILHEKRLELEGKNIKIIYLKNHKSFYGIIKAYFIAQEKNISLQHVIINYQEV